MPDAHVREVDRIEDIDQCQLIVGVDFDTVTISGHRLNHMQAERFARAFTAACWQAAMYQGGSDG